MKKEITKITTIQLTHIGVVLEEEVEQEIGLPDDCIKAIEEMFKDDMDADDVKVVQVQNFVRDIEEEE